MSHSAKRETLFEEFPQALSDLADAATRGATGRSRGVEIEMPAINAAYAKARAVLGVVYERTPVDALLSDLAVSAMLDGLDPAWVLDRIKEFGIEVGTLDAEGGRPVGA